MKDIKANDFKPKQKGESDFFSWQLYRWLRKNPYYVRVYAGNWDNILGYNPDRQVLYIGIRDDNGCFMGNKLRTICSRGHNLQAFAFESAKMRVEEWEDISEQFWTDYERIGVCAIHGDHAHDWEEKGKKRTCKRCGKTEKQVTKMVPQVTWEEECPA